MCFICAYASFVKYAEHAVTKFGFTLYDCHVQGKIEKHEAWRAYCVFFGCFLVEPVCVLHNRKIFLTNTLFTASVKKMFVILSHLYKIYYWLSDFIDKLLLLK